MTQHPEQTVSEPPPNVNVQPPPVIDPPAPPPIMPPQQRVVLGNNELRAGLGKVSDMVDNGFDMGARGAKAAVRDALGDPYTNAHAGRILNAAKAWAQDAPALGKSVAQHLGDMAADPKTLVPAIAAATGAGIASNLRVAVDPDGTTRDTVTGQFLSKDDARVKAMRGAALRAASADRN